MSLVRKKASTKLLAAVQSNGRKSPGPRMESGKRHSSLNAIQAVKEKFKEESLGRASEQLKQEHSELQQRVQKAIDEAEQKPGKGRSPTLDDINLIRERVFGLPPIAPRSEAAAGEAPPDVAIQAVPAASRG
jgi:hypothetical protein